MKLSSKESSGELSSSEGGVNPAILILVLVLGLALRFAYVLKTPPGVRGHDWSHHLLYIEHMFRYWSVPHPMISWEYYHPPFYYFLCAMFVELFGPELPELFVQYLSFMLSVGSLVLSLAIGWTVLRTSLARLVYGLLAASFPSVVFLSARINNDVLLHFVALAALFVLIRWWRKSSDIGWYLLVVLAAVATLTKMSGTILLGPIGVCLIFNPRFGLKKKLKLSVVALVIFSVLVGWYAYLRFDQLGWDMDMLGPASRLPASQMTVNTPENLCTFNPLAVVEKPFNHPWDDTYRRMYFPEFLFRSAYFGEFHYPDTLLKIGRTQILFALILIPIVMFSVVRELAKNCSRFTPLWSWGLFFVIALIYFRVSQACIPCQDFRYITPMTISMFVFLGLVFEKAYSVKVKSVVFALVAGHVISSVAFIYSLPV